MNIKKLLREGLLSEKLTDVDSDVDMIYDKYFKPSYDKIKQTGNVNDNNFEKIVISSGTLKSHDAKKAHNVNPIYIFFNTYGGNFYNPEEKMISITYPKNAFDYVNNFDGDLKKALESVPITQKNSLSKEFNEEIIKGSIHHELTHWIDDSLHNQHIKKTLDRGVKGKMGYDFDTHHIERQSQIHNIHQLKRKHNDLWDLLTFEEMIGLSPALNSVKNKLSPDEYKKWAYKLKKRMYREGLLGDEMINNS